MTDEQRDTGGRQRRGGLAARLGRRAARAGLQLRPALADRLCAYVELLQQWNARMSLTALDDGDHGLDRLVIEPLAAATRVGGGPLRVIDIGSGGGSPAIPLLLALGGGSLLMVEARTRKAVFLREAVRRLEIGDAAVETGRFEDLTTQRPLQGAFDLLTLRGVRTGSRELQQLQTFVRDGGELFLFRGAGDLPADIPAPLERRATYPLVDSLGSRLLVLCKASAKSE